MATAHLIYGYIGAGKTTYARQLEHRLPAIRFTSDEWIARLYTDDETEIPDFDLLLARVESVMHDTWSRCVELGTDVVLDMGFWARTKRDDVRSSAATHGASVRLHFLQCSDDVAWSRVEARNHDPRGSIRMSRNTFEVLKARFEPLGPDEEHVQIET